MSSRVIIVWALIVAEITAMVIVFQVLMDFQCSATNSEALCSFLRSLVARAIVLVAAVGLVAWLRWRVVEESLSGAIGPPMGRTFHATAETLVPRADPRSGGGHGWMAMHLLGFGLVLLPMLSAPALVPSRFFEQSLLPWLLGLILGTAGVLLWLAPLDRWQLWVVRERYVLLPVVFLSLLVPDLGTLVLPLWDWQALTSVTFSSVVGLLSLLGATTFSDPASYIVGLDDFYVRIGQPCSGLEGIALISSFIGLYAFLFREDLRFPHYWLIVLPLGLAASWALNVVRIAGLIAIGAQISPEIAVNGFHSYAGWMFFTLLAIGLVCVIHAIPQLQLRPGPANVPKLSEDPSAALIVPLVVLLVTGLIASAVTSEAELALPFQSLALIAVLGFFWPHYRGIRCTPDTVAVLAGAAVGVIWIATEPMPQGDNVLRDALIGLGPVAVTTWVVLRVIGFTVLVPMVEEFFFRSYLLKRLDFGGVAGQLFAVLLSSILFAALHSRWIEACVAGLVFAAVMLRRNRLGDAILAHMVANITITLMSVSRGTFPVL